MIYNFNPQGIEGVSVSENTRSVVGGESRSPAKPDRRLVSEVEPSS